MALTDKVAWNPKGRDAPYKLFDCGGLYLLVRSDGARYSRTDCRFVGNSRAPAFGVYPSITLADARE